MSRRVIPTRSATASPDAVLDALLAVEPQARVACETFATTNRVVIGGEIGLSDPDLLTEQMERIEDIARDCVRDIGYEQDEFHHATCEVTNLLHRQSAHIAQGVVGGNGREEGAGDQGIMFGYAVDETPDMMPAPILYAHAILRRLADARKAGAEPTLRPDAKIADQPALRGRRPGRGDAARAVAPARATRRRPRTTSAPSSSPTSARCCPTAG